MSDSVLTVLKFCLLALLYLFLARVVWIVARELRGTPAPAPAAPTRRGRSRAGRERRRKRASWRLVLVEPDGRTRRSRSRSTARARSDAAAAARCRSRSTRSSSQVHARAFDRDGDLWVEDLGSTQRHVRERRTHRHSPTKLAQGRPRAGRRDRARGRPMRLVDRLRPPTPGSSATNNEDSFLVDDAARAVRGRRRHGRPPRRRGREPHRDRGAARRRSRRACRVERRDRARQRRGASNAPRATTSSPAWARR